VKIIIDTNIFISAIINKIGKESDIILSPVNDFKKYSCHFLLTEVSLHKEKILKISKLKDYELLELIYKISKKIEFINEEQIPENIWTKAIEYTKVVDESDTPFIALTLYLDGLLWTGDKKLIAGLKKKNFTKIITSNQLYKS